MHKVKIALAMIVKGTDAEALMLNRCLESVAPYVDGIFITRTSFPGETKNKAVWNVAHNFGAHVSDFTWVNDFSKARNFNFSQVPKDYDYIMWSDADDIWRKIEKLRAIVEKNKTADGFGFWYLYDWDEFKTPVVVHRKTMIIKNDGCATWVGALHEDLQPTRVVDIKLIEGIDRLHISSKKRHEDNAVRNLKIAQAESEKLKEDPRGSWNLANAQFAVSDFDNARKSFIEFISTSSSNEEIYIAHTRLSNVYKSLGRRAECIKELERAIGLDPSIPDAYLQLASYYFEFGQLDKAEEYGIQGIQKRPKIHKMVVYNPRDYDFNPMMLLAQIYSAKNRPHDVLTLLKGCLKIYPKDEKLKALVKKTEKEVALMKKALTIVKKLQPIKDKKKLAKELAKVPADLQSHPAISALRNINFIKDSSSGRDLVFYCGNTVEQWSEETLKTKMVGGSEESVIHIARELSKTGWNVTVYNNCGHKALKVGEVQYRPYWEFNYRDKQDVVIVWRQPRVLDYDINATRVYLDLHDVVSDGEFTEARLKRVAKVFVKSQFHRSLFPSVPNEKITVIPNGLEIYKDESIKRDPMLIINTSSPDRSMDVMPKLFEQIKAQVPEAKMQWAYGWEGFISAHSNDAKKMQWMEDTKKEIEDAGIKSLGRLPQKEVGRLYQKAAVFAYPSEFAEIDCISVKKAQAAGAYAVTTDFGALGESNKYGVAVHSEKTKDNWNKPYQFHFGLEDTKLQAIFVELVVQKLKGGGNLLPEQRMHQEVWQKQFEWETIAKKWAQHFI